MRVVAVLYLAAAVDYCAGSSASRLSSSPAAPAPPAVAVDMVAPSHLEIMTFYDFNATAQHGWATGNVYPGQMAEWQQAWAKWKMPGMWNLEYFKFSSSPGKQPENFWNRHCVTGVWDCGLRPGWEAALGPALKKLAPLLGRGLTGVFLGDEMMLAGISAANITAAADFIRAALGSKAKIYWNDGCRPWYDGHVDPCIHDGKHNPASCWTNESKVPASVDWVSCDIYQDPTTNKTGPWPWDPSPTVSEATAKRYIAEHHIYPKLHPHQKVVMLPGLFGNRSDAWTDDWLVKKVQEYWAWGKEDPRVAGFCGYHYNTRTFYPQCPGLYSDGPCPTLHGHACCYKYGAGAYPRLNALLQQIGRSIMGGRADASNFSNFSTVDMTAVPPLRTDDPTAQVGPGLKWLSGDVGPTYLGEQKKWVNLAIPGGCEDFRSGCNCSACFQNIDAAWATGIPSLARMPQHEVYTRPARFPNGSDSSVGGLISGWQNTLREWASKVVIPRLTNGSVSGVFLGDEICCHNSSCWHGQLYPLSSHLRSLLGSSALLQTNECQDSLTGGDYKSHGHKVDLYAGYTPGSKGSDEVEQDRAFFNKEVFPRMAAHQRAGVIPGVFACSNLSYISLVESEAHVVAKLQGYWEWSQAEPRLASWYPWHYTNRTGAQSSGACDMRLGAEAMPRVLDKLAAIAGWMKQNQSRSLQTGDAGEAPWRREG